MASDIDNQIRTALCDALDDALWLITDFDERKSEFESLFKRLLSDALAKLPDLTGDRSKQFAVVVVADNLVKQVTATGTVAFVGNWTEDQKQAILAVVEPKGDDVMPRALWARFFDRVVIKDEIASGTLFRAFKYLTDNPQKVFVASTVEKLARVLQADIAS